VEEGYYIIAPSFYFVGSRIKIGHLSTYTCPYANFNIKPPKKMYHPIKPMEKSTHSRKGHCINKVHGSEQGTEALYHVHSC
jgi:hypothetical protein